MIPPSGYSALPLVNPALYRALAYQMPHAAAFVVDHELRYWLAEGEALYTCGMKSQDFEGRLISETASADIASGMEVDYRMALSGHAFEREHSVNSRHFVTHGVPLRNDAGAVYAALAVSYDITSRKVGEETLRIAQDELRESVSRKDEFLAMLAHELRNPLFAISNSLQILRLSPANALATQCHNVIERQAIHLARLVDDLLDVSRVGQGKVNLQKRPVVLQQLLNQVVEVSRRLIDKAGHVLTTHMPETAVTVVADPIRLAQVVTNILNNAAKYTPNAGNIELTLARGKDEVLISVKDNGLGIAPDMLLKVFDLFTQVDSSINHAQGGLGIGLSLVKSIVELHGGTITAHSDGAGLGSTFTVRLPAGC